MNSLVNECIKSIDAIDTNSYASELAICESLLDAYSHAAMILECCNGDDLSPFSCFTESAISHVYQESDDDEKLWEFEPRRDKKNGVGKENILWSIIAFIPRLLYAIGRFIVRGLKQIFTSKKACEEMEKNLVEKVHMTKKEQRDEETKTWYNSLVNSIYNNQDAEVNKMVGNIGRDSEGNLVNIFAFALNEELFAPSAFEKGRGGVYENVFYLFPVTNIREFIDAVRQYHAEVVRVCSIQFKSMLENDIGEKKSDSLIRNLITQSAKIAGQFETRVRLASSVASMQKSTKRPNVKIDGIDSMDYRITPKEYYTLCDELSKVSSLIVADSKDIENSIAKLRENPDKFTATLDEGYEKLLKNLKICGHSISVISSAIFGIGKLYPLMLKNLSKEFNHSVLSSDRKELNKLTSSKIKESAVTEMGDSFYQDENISAAAY